MKNKLPKHDSLPRKKTIWLLFDIDNGHGGSHHYVWWLKTRKQARSYKKWILKRKNSAELVGPVKAKISSVPNGALKGTRLS